MAKVWVKAKSIVRVDENGTNKTIYPGDWAFIGKQQAREELVRNSIEILKPAVLQSVIDLNDCAIFLKGDLLPELRIGLMRAQFPGVPLQKYENSFPSFGRFLIWDTSVTLKQELILTGFKLLEKWQLAVPLKNYNVLAENIGTSKEREETKKIIHDLRVPIYNTKVIFIRQCKETRKLFGMWDGTELGFLQALYQSRPVVNALPPTWVME